MNPNLPTGQAANNLAFANAVANGTTQAKGPDIWQSPINPLQATNPASGGSYVLPNGNMSNDPQNSPADLARFNVNTPIDSSSLGSANPLSLPSINNTTSQNAASIIAPAQAGVDALTQAQQNVSKENANLQPLQDQRTGIISKIGDLYNSITGAQTAAQTNPQLDQANTDLTNLNKQIADTTVAYRGEKDAANGNGSISQFGQQTNLTNVDAKYGRALADLAIRQGAATQNINVLTTAADRKLALTLAPLQSQVDYYKNFVLANNDTLTQQEKDKINQVITEKNNLITQATTQQTAKTTQLLDIMKAGVKIPDSVMVDYNNAPTAEAAAQVLVKAGINIAPYQKLTDALGNEYLAQPGGGSSIGNGGGNSTGNSGGSTSIAGTGSSGTPNAATTGTGANKLSFEQYGLLANTDFNPKNTWDTMAQKYLDVYLKKGVEPSTRDLGTSVKAGAMATINARASALYYQATGTPLPNPAVIQANQGILAKNLQLANNLQVQEQTVSANVDFSIANMKKNGLDSAGFKPLSSAINTVADMFNDPATGQLIAQNTTIQNELGSLLAVKNASGTTVYDKLSSAGIITSSDSPAQVKAKVSALITEASNFASSLNTANANLYKQIDPLMQDANNPLRQQHIDSKTVDQALSSKNINYNDVVSRTPAGQIPVIDKQGNVGYITPAEFDPAKYTKL